MSDGNGALPEGWTTAKLGDLASFINGDRGKNYPNKKEYVPSGLPFINTGHIQLGGCLSLESMHFITREKFDSLGGGKIESGDLVYCLRGATLGKTAFVEPFTEGAIASSLVIIRPAELECKRFLYYFMVSPPGKEEIEKYDNGTAQPNLSARSVRAYSVPLPPLAEQRRIVSKIESLEVRSSRARRALSEVGPLLEQFRHSVLRAVFSGRLTADWRTAHRDVEPATELLSRIRTERRHRWEQWETFKYEVRGKKAPKNLASRYDEPETSEGADTSDLPEIPSTWCWATIDEVGIVGSGKRLPKGSKLVAHDTGFPYIRAGNLKGGTVRGEILFLTKEDYETIPQYNVSAGDNYLTIVGASIGDAGTIPPEFDGVNLTENAAKIMAVIDSAYLGYILRSPTLQDQIQRKILSAAQGKLALGRIKQLIVPVPPIAEQAKIASLVTELLERIEDSASEAASYESALTQLDQSILAKAFRGELVPQDPRDEPASELLARIRTTRDAATPKKNAEPEAPKDA